MLHKQMRQVKLQLFGKNEQILEIYLCVRGVAQPGSVLRSGRRGRRFKSSHLDNHTYNLNKRDCLKS